jgi:putative DNA-binding protein
MIRYKIVSRKNPSTKAEKFHPALVSPAPIDSQKIIDRIEKKCTLASSDIKAVVDALEVELIDALRDGNAVRLGDLGSFRPSLRSKGVEKKEDANASQITRMHVVFVPALRVKRALDVKTGHLQFAKTEMTPVVKKKKKAEK